MRPTYHSNHKIKHLHQQNAFVTENCNDNVNKKSIRPDIIKKNVNLAIVIYIKFWSSVLICHFIIIFETHCSGSSKTTLG